mgnify:CR=1 FL=1
MARKVTVIPSIINPKTKLPNIDIARRKVAGYARVSTDSDEQFTSYEAQVDYYTKYIKSNPEWEFVEVYTDEGITGTNTKKREGFKRMVSDALAGKIDLIVTKSISRFARNTVDSLVTIRKLKVAGVECFFENLVKENASTPQSQDEYIMKYESLRKRYEEEYTKLGNLQKDKELRVSKSKAMEVFIENLKNQTMAVESWDESLWALMIEKAVVSGDGSIKFIFYNGTEIIEEA